MRIPGHQRLGLGLPVARTSNYFYIILYHYNENRCQFPQITAQGLDDSITHGAVSDYLFYYIPDIQLTIQDLRAVYASRLDLGNQMDPNSAIIRGLGLIIVNLRHRWTFFLPPPKGVTNSVITSQVASGLLQGLFPFSSPQYVSAFIEQLSYDSLEPSYSCPTAYTILSNYTTGSGGQKWQTHLTQAASLYAKLDQVSGISSPDTAGWHVSFDQCVFYLFFSPTFQL